MIAIVEHRREVGGDALHPARADRLDPRLLDRIEQRPGRRILRRVAPMHRVAVASETQRERVRLAANDRRLPWIRLARRLRQARLRAFRAGRQRRLVGGKGDLKFGMAGERPRARGKARLNGSFGASALAPVCGCWSA